jgi:hypothetical protein
LNIEVNASITLQLYHGLVRIKKDVVKITLHHILYAF